MSKEKKKKRAKHTSDSGNHTWFSARMNKKREEKIMIYKCKSCSFLFHSEAETDQCPDCGKKEVRPADESEQKEYWNYQKEFYPERHDSHNHINREV